MQPTARVTEDEYLALERTAVEKHELVNGHIVAMSGASYRHNAIASNANAALHGLLKGKGCRPVASDQRVHIPATGLYTYPDVLVICGPPQLHARDPMTVLNPRLIIEVLSSTTEAYDRGAKFAHYRSIPSLQTYLMVSQDEVRAERFERGEAGVWTMHEMVAPDGIVALPSIDASLSMRDLYADLPPE